MRYTPTKTQSPRHTIPPISILQSSALPTSLFFASHKSTKNHSFGTGYPSGSFSRSLQHYTPIALPRPLSPRGPRKFTTRCGDQEKDGRKPSEVCDDVIKYSKGRMEIAYISRTSAQSEQFPPSRRVLHGMPIECNVAPNPQTDGKGQRRD